MWFDKLLDRKAPGLRGLLLVVVLALMGAVLVVQGVQHWRAGERSAERSRLLQQTADHRWLHAGGRVFDGAEQAAAQGHGAGPLAP